MIGVFKDCKYIFCFVTLSMCNCQVRNAMNSQMVQLDKDLTEVKAKAEKYEAQNVSMI